MVRGILNKTVSKYVTSCNVCIVECIIVIISVPSDIDFLKYDSQSD
jgi:hypothetical protein